MMVWVIGFGPLVLVWIIDAYLDSFYWGKEDEN